jgi:hypothetical protein
MPGSVLGSPKEPRTDRDVPFKEITIGTVRSTADSTVRSTADSTVRSTADSTVRSTADSTVRSTADSTVRAQGKAGRLGNGT